MHRRNLIGGALLIVGVMQGGGCDEAGAEIVDAGLTAPTHASGWASWPMPNPASTGLPNPQTYDVSVRGIVRDKVTGLTWQRDVSADSLLWVDANAYCNGLSLGAHDDWRLPELIELVSIVDFTQASPSIDSTVFPDTPPDSFWTSSPMVGSPGEFWYIGFSTGYDYHGHPDFLAIKVRCVR